MSDAEQELNALKVRVAEHAIVLSSMDKTMARISKAIEAQVRLSERVVALDARHQESARVLHSRLDKQELADKELLGKIGENHAQIMRWSGALAAIAGALTVFGLAAKLLGVENG